MTYIDLMLVIGFTGLLKFVITIYSGAIANFHTVCSSLEQALNLLSQLCLHQSSSTGFQRQAFPLLGSRTVSVPQPQPQPISTDSALNSSSNN
jgi:hypothetical protein